MPANENPGTVREYVGARYVPVFANPIEWSDTRGYEPLTIVTHQGNSYTSMQYVPTGIDIQNTAYWALTGNYNAQIEQYRREVQEFDGRIDANAQDIDGLQLVVGDLSPAYMVVIGDSYSSYDYNPKETAWHTLVGQQLNCEVKNYAVSGAGYTVAGKLFATQAAAAVADTTFNNNAVKYVFVYGGRNDTAITQNSVSTLIGTLKTGFPKAQIIVIGVNTWVTYTNNDDVRTNEINTVCSNMGITFMNSLWMLQSRASRFGTNNHPNATGNAYEAYWILSHMFGTLVDQFYQHRVEYELLDSTGAEVEGVSGNITYQCNSTTRRLTIALTLPSITQSGNYTLNTPGFYIGGLIAASTPVLGGTNSVLGYISGSAPTSLTFHLNANSNGINVTSFA